MKRNDQISATGQTCVCVCVCVCVCACITARISHPEASQDSKRVGNWLRSTRWLGYGPNSTAPLHTMGQAVAHARVEEFDIGQGKAASLTVHGYSKFSCYISRPFSNFPPLFLYSSYPFLLTSCWMLLLFVSFCITYSMEEERTLWHG